MSFCFLSVYSSIDLSSARLWTKGNSEDKVKETVSAMGVEDNARPQTTDQINTLIICNFCSTWVVFYHTHRTASSTLYNIKLLVTIKNVITDLLTSKDKWKNGITICEIRRVLQPYSIICVILNWAMTYISIVYKGRFVLSYGGENQFPAVRLHGESGKTPNGRTVLAQPFLRLKNTRKTLICLYLISII